MTMQVSFPGQPDPTTLGRFLQRMLFLLSKPEAAAAILGVEWPPPVSAVKPRPRASAAKLPGPKGKRLSAARLAAEGQLASAAPLQSLAEQTAQGQDDRDGSIGSQAPSATVPFGLPASAAEVQISAQVKSIEVEFRMRGCSVARSAEVTN